MRSNVKARAVCPGCGPMVVPAAELRCELEAAGRQGICELKCPVCSTTVLLPAVSPEVETLWRAGAGHMIGSVPFELLEPHTGPPLSWDDVLDFKLALESDSASRPEAGV
ncbi:MAG: hypothetical protein ACRD0O_19880 [Acidimicrobiia bacterium]